MNYKFLIAGSALLLSSTVNAIDFGVGVKAGTVGTGAEISIALTQTINARVSLTDVSYDFDETVDVTDNNNSATIDANLDMDFGASALLLDWYVFDGTFHITAGMMKNDSSISMVGNFVDNNIILNGTPYDVSADFVDSSIRGEISAGESYEPYLGIGWGRKADDDPGLSLSVEIGVVLMDPSVNLTPPTAVDPNLQAQLNADVEEAENAANDDLSDLEAWPILSVGLNYAF